MKKSDIIIRYICRVISYFITMSILTACIYAILILSKQSNVNINIKTIASVAIVIFLFSIIYPFLGYTKSKIFTTLNNHDFNQITKEYMKSKGYKAVKQDENISKYVSSNITKRIFKLGQESIIIIKNNDEITIDGPRKDLIFIVRGLNTKLGNTYER